MRTQLSATDRLIVALDVPSTKEAIRFVDDLDGLVSFFKVGLELLMSGGIDTLVRNLVARDKRVFVDLKLPGDIDETIRRAVRLSADMGATLLTLSSSVSPQTIRAAREGRGESKHPFLLFVSYLSSLDETDYRALHAGADVGLEAFVAERSRVALHSGCDGLIASGDSIRMLRSTFKDTIIVSPGIRPPGASADDHKRLRTPREAISEGADYLVVGRPIRDALDRRQAAEAIIAGIKEGLTPAG